ncbi:hypothetical protein LMG28688_03828 [Paraburkholderia caffeinitolerans]|uniref:Uncharacterized protein n=1 Tax=Paraburkholderia caffeinitolerans TaxID=1723730 RepID=A0A6J5G6K1_9BURK|nr:hypothetical protein LMG28688_03828 [Paraburkholderia caffeinitolerans]
MKPTRPKGRVGFNSITLVISTLASFSVRCAGWFSS